MPRSFDLNDHSPLEPHELKEIYDSGFKGVLYDAFERAYAGAFAESFYAMFPKADGIGKGKVSLPYKAALSLEPEFGRYEAQGTGDCVSHNQRNAGMIDYCVDAMFGETKYKGRFATENIYGDRGHSGQGASCDRLAIYTGPNGKGGFLVRQKYETSGGTVDLSTYNWRIGDGWGGRGTPSWLNEIASQNKALRVFRCDSLEMARDAIAMGFGISRCGWYGYSNKRNEDGVSDVSGRWSHAMAWIGCDDTDAMNQKYGGPLILTQNSWGLWNSGPKRHDQPDGSFWVRSRFTKEEIDAGGVYIIASVRGFDRELVYDRWSTLNRALYSAA